MTERASKTAALMVGALNVTSSLSADQGELIDGWCAWFIHVGWDYPNYGLLSPHAAMYGHSGVAGKGKEALPDLCIRYRKRHIGHSGKLWGDKFAPRTTNVAKPGGRTLQPFSSGRKTQPLLELLPRLTSTLAYTSPNNLGIPLAVATWAPDGKRPSLFVTGRPSFGAPAEMQLSRVEPLSL